jgi:hypothetical protein
MVLSLNSSNLSDRKNRGSSRAKALGSSCFSVSSKPNLGWFKIETPQEPFLNGVMELVGVDLI